MAQSSALGQLEVALQHRGRHLGAHYTPHAIVDRAVRTALDPLCRGRSAGQVLALRVLDPAVGSGRFLLSALERLADAAGGHRAAIAARCLFGIDVDPAAVTLARQALARAAGCPVAALAPSIVVADSLTADVPSLLGVESFDAVLTNPPWLSFSGRQATELPPERRRLLAERFASFRGWPTTHGAFLELAAGLLGPDGRAALIVPHQVCHLPGYESTRQAVLARCRFEPPPEFLGEGCFPGVVQPAAIVHLRRSTEAGVGLRAPVDEADAAILRLVRRHPPAPPRTFRDPGVHTGNSARLILHAEPGPGRAPVREGRCIRPFALDPPTRWLDVEPQLPPGHYCRIGPFGAYAAARILVRQTANRPVAARHTAPMRFRNSVLACRGIPGLDDSTLVGLLNSTLLAYVHRCSHADSGQRAFPQVKVGHLQALPIAREADALRPVALRLEALAAEGASEAGMAQEREALDRLAYGLYGLSSGQAQHVAERMADPS